MRSIFKNKIIISSAAKCEHDQYLSLGHLHINFGCWDEEGLRKEIWGSEVCGERGDGLHTEVESLKLRVSREDSLVVAESKKDLNCLVQLEVGQRERACEVVLVAQEFMYEWESLESLVNNFLLRRSFQTQHHEAKNEIV